MPKTLRPRSSPSPASGAASFLARGEASLLKSEAFLLEGEASPLESEAFLPEREASTSKSEASLFKDEAFLLEGEASPLKGEASLLKSKALLPEREASLLKSEAFLFKSKAFLFKSEAFLLAGKLSLRRGKMPRPSINPFNLKEIPMPDRNLTNLIAKMDTLSANLKGRLPEVPLLEPLQTDLEAWLAETRGLENQQEIYTARLRETNEKRRKAEARGFELFSQADAALRGQFGTKNKLLHEFGLKPRGGRRATKKGETTAPAPGVTPPATTAK